MFSRIVKELGEFPNAVLTGLDPEGYPFSVRCRPESDAAAQVFRVQVPEGVPIRPGRAGLLCHKHDELLWHLRSFLVRGTLERGERGWALRPEEFVPGAGIGGVMSLVKWVLGARRDTKRYLAKRGLPRPTVPWDEINAIKEQAKRGK